MTANKLPVNTATPNSSLAIGAQLNVPSVLVAGCGPKARRHRRLLKRSGRFCTFRDIDGNQYTCKVSVNSQSDNPVEGVISVRHRMGYISSCELSEKGFVFPADGDFEGFVVETPEISYHVHSGEIETSGEEIVRYALRLVG